MSENKEKNFGHCFDQKLYKVTFWGEFKSEEKCTVKYIAAQNVYHLIDALHENNKEGSSGIQHPSKIKDIEYISSIDRLYLQTVSARTVVKTLGREIDKNGKLVDAR